MTRTVPCFLLEQEYSQIKFKELSIFCKKDMKKKIFLAIIAVLAMYSCSDHGTPEDEVKYDPSELSEVEAVALSLEGVEYDSVFSRPDQMDFIGDSLLVVHDKLGNENIAHLISVGGKYVHGFGKIGKGHGEMLAPHLFSVGEDGKSIYYFDWSTKSTIKFSLDSILAGSNACNVLKTGRIDGASEYGLNDVWHIADEAFYGFGYDDVCRLMAVEDGKVQDIYTTYPPVDENEENKWSIWNNMAKIGVSPDHKHIVIGTAIGSMFEVFSVDNGKISRDVFKAFYKPIYRLAQGAVPACVVATEETVWGFTSLYCTNESFWGVMGGEGFSHRDVIYEFSYSGELLNKYKVDGQVEVLAVNPQGEMYLVMTGEDKDLHLMRADLNNVKRRKP